MLSGSLRSCFDRPGVSWPESQYALRQAAGTEPAIEASAVSQGCISGQSANEICLYVFHSHKIAGFYKVLACWKELLERACFEQWLKRT